jgi:hypothetical protein
MKVELTTADIGIAIRDFLEDQDIEALDWESGDPGHNPPHGKATIVFIDVGDPHDPVIDTDCGMFRISIVKVG